MSENLPVLCEAKMHKTNFSWHVNCIYVWPSCRSCTCVTNTFLGTVLKFYHFMDNSLRTLSFGVHRARFYQLQNIMQLPWFDAKTAYVLNVLPLLDICRRTMRGVGSLRWTLRYFINLCVEIQHDSAASADSRWQVRKHSYLLVFHLVFGRYLGIIQN